jgi:hypothetical protein
MIVEAARGIYELVIEMKILERCIMLNQKKYPNFGRNEMKSNRLTNILLVAVLAVLLSGRWPAASPTRVQPVAAAPAAPGGYLPQAPLISGYVSVPAAAFHPASNSEVYTNYGYTLSPGSATYSVYVAALSLPDGATIDGLDCVMVDYNPTDNGACRLYNVALSGPDIATSTLMGTAMTNHSTIDPTLYSTTSIIDAQVDNSRHAYNISLYLPYDNNNNYISFWGLRIHYYYSAVYLPSVSK